MESAGPVIERLDRSKIKYITIDGITTRYYEDGRGEPLVLFPGGNYASLYSLDAFTLNFEGLAKHFHVFAIDKLGQGHSGNPLHDRDWTVEALVEYTHKLLVALADDMLGRSGRMVDAVAAIGRGREVDGPVPPFIMSLYH